MIKMTTKKILFNKSSLVSLKAELLRKQEEVNGKKHLPQHRIEDYRPPPIKKADEKNESCKQSKKSFRDHLKETDIEELEQCRKAKLALEKKAELYEHLADGVGNSQLSSNFLVDFNTKKQQESLKSQENDEIKTVEPESGHYSDQDESEWTEFTDCLGRTRKCLKSDIDFYKKRDQELMKTINGDTQKESGSGERMDSEKEKPILVQKTNDYLHSLRQKWEEKERELLAKDKDIHYQDLLYDEARIHGVGYYSFSTDEAERHKQMDELMKMREETLKAQKEAEEKRKKHEELIAARVAAARARHRAKAGLPPEEKIEKIKDFTESLLDFLTQQRNEAENKAKEAEKKEQEEKEKERQKQREAYVREWDIGKEGVEKKVKKFRMMTQEEYVEQQRAKRLEEFAPPQLFQDSCSTGRTFDEKGKVIEEPSTSKSWSDVRPSPRTPPPPPPEIGDLSEIAKGLYFTTVKKNESGMKYKNFVKSQEITPIVNEVDSDGIETKCTRKRKHESDHAEIAPPPTYDYYGPTPKHSKSNIPFNSDIREAYAQGTKSLEKKSMNRKLNDQYDFTFD